MVKFFHLPAPTVNVASCDLQRTTLTHWSEKKTCHYWSAPNQWCNETVCVYRVFVCMCLYECVQVCWHPARKNDASCSGTQLLINELLDWWRLKYWFDINNTQHTRLVGHTSACVIRYGSCWHLSGDDDNDDDDDVKLTSCKATGLEIWWKFFFTTVHPR